MHVLETRAQCVREKMKEERTFSLPFLSLTGYQVMTSQRKLDMVGTHSTVWKRAKRTPDMYYSQNYSKFVIILLKIGRLLQISFISPAFQGRHLNP